MLVLTEEEMRTLQQLLQATRFEMGGLTLKEEEILKKINNKLKEV